jgi:hypothetical protein
MIKALLRNFILLAIGCLISLSVLAQNSTITNNLLLVNEREESFKSFSLKVLNKSSLLNYQQSTVLSEVRRGYERLSKTCASAPSQSLNPLANKGLLAQIDLLQSSLDKQVTVLQNALNKQSDKVLQSKSKACSGLALPFLKSKSCQFVEDLSNGAQNLSAALDLYQKTYQSRYTIYRALVAKEGEGCIRAGFSDRLMRANESQMEALESFALEQFASLIEEVGVLIPTSP